MLVLLVSPLSLLVGSELLGLGAELPGAAPEGVLDIEPVLLDELDDGDELPGIVLDGELIDDDDGDDDDDDDGLIVDGDVVLVVVLELDGIDGLVVVVVELLSVVGVAGGSVLLHAPSAARAAAIATHLIELRMFNSSGH